MSKIPFGLFKKKEPALPQFDTALGKEHDLGLSLGEEAESHYPGASSMAPSMPGMPSSRPAASEFESQRQAQQQFMQPSSVEKDIQILNAKLDALKAILDNINQRLANIERIANESQKYEKY